MLRHDVALPLVLARKVGVATRKCKHADEGPLVLLFDVGFKRGLGLEGRRLLAVPAGEVAMTALASLALLSTSEPYSVSSMWEARTRSDYYTVSLETGERKPIAQADYSRFRLSPAGRYAYAYAETEMNETGWSGTEMLSAITARQDRQKSISTRNTWTAWLQGGTNRDGANDDPFVMDSSAVDARIDVAMDHNSELFMVDSHTSMLSATSGFRMLPRGASL